MNTLQKKKLRGTGVNCGLIVLLFAVVLLLGQVLPDNTYRRVLVPIIWQMCIFILLGTSLNLTLGYLGQLTLGHMGFAGIGAYTAALSSLALERAGVFEASKAAPGQLILVVLGCCLLGAVFAGLLGLLVGIPALRLRGDYLAIITLGFGEIIRVILTNIDSVLGFEFTYGAAGLKRIPKFSSFNLVFFCVVFSCMLIHMVMKSRHGRAILSIRENEIASESVGVPTTYYKTFAFVLSAMLAGVAGCLYAGYLGSLYPANFEFMKSIECRAAFELWRSTDYEGYKTRMNELLPTLLEQFNRNASVIAQMIPFMDNAFKKQVRPLVEAYAGELVEVDKENPYGVRISTAGWAGNRNIVQACITNYLLHRSYPELIKTPGIFVDFLVKG